MDQIEEPAMTTGSPDTVPEPPGSEDPPPAAATGASRPTKRRSSSAGPPCGSMDRGISTLPCAYDGDDDDSGRDDHAAEEGHDVRAVQRVLVPANRPWPTKRRRLEGGQCARGSPAYASIPPPSAATDSLDPQDFLASGTGWLPSPSPSPSLSPSSLPPTGPRRRRIGDDALDGVDEHIADHAILRVRAQRRVVARAAYVVVFRVAERVLRRPLDPRGWDAHGKLSVLWQGDDTGPAGVAVSEGCQVSVTCGRVRLVK